MTSAGEPLPTRRQLDRRATRYAIRRTWHGFILHRDIDAAAAITFYSALSLFPAALTLVSGLALFDSGDATIELILDVVGRLSQPDTTQAVRAILDQLSLVPNSGWALVIGTVFTLWTVSSFSTAFGRAMNNVYEVEEGRRLTKNRILMLGVAAGLIACFLVIGVIVAITPSVAAALVASLGWPGIVAELWSALKWIPLALVAVFTVGFLYYGTPNLHRRRLRWLSVGATFTVATWTLAALLFGFYLTVFATYDRLYGWLGVPIAALIWLYISSAVLMIGVEVDAELTRARQLLAGLPAEETIQVPLRDTARTSILARRWSADLSDGRELRRLSHLLRETEGDPTEAPGQTPRPRPGRSPAARRSRARAR
jgi:membrane protein